MEESKYRVAGWLAVVQAILFPLGFLVGFAEAGLAAGLLDIKRPFVGPSDLIMLLFTSIAVYTLLMFRRLLHERYDYHDLDLLILISIWWAIVFQAVSIGVGVLAMFYWPADRIIIVVTYLVILTAAMVTIGIVDIMIGVKLLRVKETFSEFIRGLAYVTLAAGVLEVTVLLSPLSLLLVPVSAIMLALIFLRDKQELEFV